MKTSLVHTPFTKKNLWSPHGVGAGDVGTGGIMLEMGLEVGFGDGLGVGLWVGCG